MTLEQEITQCLFLTLSGIDVLILILCCFLCPVRLHQTKPIWRNKFLRLGKSRPIVPKTNHSLLLRVVYIQIAETFWFHTLIFTPISFMFKQWFLIYTVISGVHGKSCNSSLLDKVMSRNQWHIGVHQYHLMFKCYWRAPHETIYGHKKEVCLDTTFPLGHFMLHFIMFLHTSNDYKS